MDGRLTWKIGPLSHVTLEFEVAADADQKDRELVAWCVRAFADRIAPETVAVNVEAVGYTLPDDPRTEWVHGDDADARTLGFRNV